jgi:hypothetical protein
MSITYEEKFQVNTTKQTRKLMEALLLHAMNEEGCLIKKAEAFEMLVRKFAIAEGVHV